MSNYFTPPEPQPKPSGWKRGLKKLERVWEENPMGVAIVAAGVMTAAAKLIDSIGSYQSKRAYAEEARRRSEKR